RRSQRSSWGSKAAVRRSCSTSFVLRTVFRLLADLGDRHILVLRNHGLLIVGTSIAADFVATYRMERACAMQLAFQQSGAASYPITDELVSAAYNRPTGGRNDPDKFEWPALPRKLDP